MWQVLNQTPFAAAGAFERDRDGREHWGVAVRGTFSIAPDGALHRIPDQPDVRRAPVYAGAEAGELCAEPDVAPFLTGTDVLLSGTVRVPSRAPAVLPLTLQIGRQTKRARLFGARTARRGLFGWDITQEGPVADTALSWRHSFGGAMPGEGGFWIESNPLGTGVALHPDAGARRGAKSALPLIESAQGDLVDTAAQAVPVGFGAVARHWAPRRAFAGTYDAAWHRGRAPLLPQDFDILFYNTAPADQVIAAGLKGGEPIALEGFAPEPIGFRLPQAILTAQTRLGTAVVPSRFRLGRVEIDLDTRTVAVVWITTVPCGPAEAHLRSTAVRLQQFSGAML